MDEYFVHQIPEPLPNVVTHHEYWRESLFFIVHPRDGLGDVVILTLAHFPSQEHMDALQLGRIGDVPTIARHVRPYDGDPHTMAVGPVRIDIAEPLQDACTCTWPTSRRRRCRSTSPSRPARVSTACGGAR